MTPLIDQLEHFERWWATTPPGQRRALYRPRSLADATGVPLQALASVAILAGWQRATRWLVGSDGRRKRRTYYAPPGSTVPRSRPRGRPPLTLDTVLGRRTPTPFDRADGAR